MQRLIPFLTAAGLVIAAAVSASATEIIDEGAFFSPGVLKSANQTIAELEARYHREIHIETYASVPADKADAVAKMSKAEKDAYFVSWIKQRAQATNANGLFLLICKEPAHLHPAVGESLVQSGFTPQARQRVVEALLTNFRDHQYDRGLSQGLLQIRTEFSKLPATSPAAPAHAAPVRPVPHRPEPAGNFGGIVIIGLVIVGGLILLSVLGRAFSGGAAGGFGGGGFGTGLMGGILGALAGNWLYDSFSGHHGRAYGGEDAGTHPFGGNDVSTGDSGGGDFGSGADFGGGGDFGGGDFGGGGDF